jgi:hypothetical protein
VTSVQVTLTDDGGAELESVAAEAHMGRRI